MLLRLARARLTQTAAAGLGRPAPCPVPTVAWGVRVLGGRSLAGRVAAAPAAAGDDGSDADGAEAAEAGVGPGVSADGAAWGGAALAATRAALARDEWAGLRLFAFSASPAGRLGVRLDKLADPHGSPSLAEVEGFARALGEELEAALGAEAAGGIEVEVSSPGAERAVRVPDELERFAALPVRVEYLAAPDAAPDAPATGAPPPPRRAVSEVLRFEGLEGGVTRWRVADVRANRGGGAGGGGKGRGLTRAQRDRVVAVPLADVRRVSLHVDL